MALKHLHLLQLSKVVSQRRISYTITCVSISASKLDFRTRIFNRSIKEFVNLSTLKWWVDFKLWHNMDLNNILFNHKISVKFRVLKLLPTITPTHWNLNSMSIKGHYDIRGEPWTVTTDVRFTIKGLPLWIWWWFLVTCLFVEIDMSLFNS